MTRTKRPGQFFKTCVACGFKGTRGLRGMSYEEARQRGYQGVGPGICRHRGACQQRQVARARRETSQS